MRYEQSVVVEAPRARVWSVLADVDRWPEWTASMTSVRSMQGDRLALGSRVRIKQPRLPEMVWEVTEIVPETSFTWQARSGGITTVATHRLTASATGGVTVDLEIRQRGALAGLVGLLTSGMTRRYLRMEAEGLKRHSEATP